MIEYSKNRTDWIFQFAEAGKINYCVRAQRLLLSKNVVSPAVHHKQFVMVTIHSKAVHRRGNSTQASLPWGNSVE
jgi:hypothetical protein